MCGVVFHTRGRGKNLSLSALEILATRQGVAEQLQTLAGSTYLLWHQLNDHTRGPVSAPPQKLVNINIVNQSLLDMDCNEPTFHLFKQSI